MQVELPLILSPAPTLCLRKWREDDGEAFVRYANNKNVSDNLSDAFPSPYTIEDWHRFYARISVEEPARTLAIEFDGRPVGSIGVHPKDDISRLNAELGYFLGEPHWGKGIMTLAVRGMIGYGFATLPVERIYARPFPHNVASQRVLEKAGMTLDAVISRSLIKNGVVMDEIIYSIRREDMKQSGSALV